MTTALGVAILQVMQGPSFGMLMRAIEDDHRPTCENESKSKNDAAKKPRKCGSRMVKAVLFQAEGSNVQWMCPACTVHLIELHSSLSTELSERVWVVVRRDPMDPFWKWAPEPIREAAAKYGFGTNSHGPRRTVCIFGYDVWCDDGYACIRATDNSSMHIVEALRCSGAIAYESGHEARKSIHDRDESAYRETVELLLAQARHDESRLRTAAIGPMTPTAVTAPTPSKNKMMLNKNTIAASHVSATFAFTIGDVRVPPEHVWMLEEMHGAALSWYEHEQCALGVVDGNVVAIIRSVGARAAAAAELDETGVEYG